MIISIICGTCISPTDTYTLGYAEPAVALCKLVDIPKILNVVSINVEPTVINNNIIAMIANTTKVIVAGLFFNHSFLLERSFPSNLSIKYEAGKYRINVPNVKRTI